MEVAERRPFPASSAAENGSEIANRNSLWVKRGVEVKLLKQTMGPVKTPIGQSVTNRFDLMIFHGSDRFPADKINGSG